jgi:cytochrome c peroxidase
MRSIHAVLLVALGAVVACTQVAAPEANIAKNSSALDAVGTRDPDGEFKNADGKAVTVSLAGSVDTTNAFFQDLGTNGRACVTCHALNDGLGLSVENVRKRFFDSCRSGEHGELHNGTGGASNASDESRNHSQSDKAKDEPSCGEDPLFRLVDGANSPNADVSTDAARVSAYSLLLTRAVIRIPKAPPATADFVITKVDDPYGVSTASNPSFYRRPLATTNLRFSGAFEPARTNAMPIMWDGRETETGCGVSTVGVVTGAACGAGLAACMTGQTCVAGFCRILPQCNNPPIARVVSDILKAQANHAHLGHAEAAAPLTDEQQNSIVDFERGLFTAQIKDKVAGALDIDGANGGPQYLSTVPFFNGENRAPPIGPGFVDFSFTTYNAWVNAQPASDSEEDIEQAARRASIARGQDLFNHRRGINPKYGVKVVNKRDTTCVFCHSAFEAGSDSAGTWGNGVSDAIGDWTSRPMADLPVYTVRSKTTGKVKQTTDLGRAAVTGKFNDLNKFKPPVLRGLAARAPYFHNGSAATLRDVVTAYEDAGFQFGFTEQDKDDLAAFLQTL